MQRNIIYNSYDFNSNGISVIKFDGFADSMRKVNLQGFAAMDGSQITSTEFIPKVITLTCQTRKNSQSALDTQLDDIKKDLQNVKEKTLSVDYIDGTRDFIATSQDIVFLFEQWTIDYIVFQVKFIVSDPPFGEDSDYSSVVSNLNYSTVGTVTVESSGSITHNGTIPPYENLVFTFNSVTSVNKIVFTLTNSDGYVTETRIDQQFETGDILQISIEYGQVTLNGDAIDYGGALPRFTLEGNSYTVKVVGDVYDIDLTFRYYALWA